MESLDPREYQPRLSRWGHTWRFLLMLALSAVGWIATFSWQWEEVRWLWFVDLTLGVAAYVLVVFRRRWPLLVAVVTSLMTTVSVTAGGPATLASVSLATWQRKLQIAVVGLLGITSYQVYVALQLAPRSEEPYWLTLGFNVALTVGMLGWGLYIGSRRQLMWQLRQRAIRAEAEQEMRVAQARGTERARIAREMHDVLAHRISQISMHAGAMAFREDLDAESLRGTARVVQTQAHEALTELRDVLGVLRDVETGQLADRPQPTYGDLGHLVEDARESGLAVTFSDRIGAEHAVPEVVGRTVYRIVQEGMTNARKHAPGAVLDVEVSGDPESGVDVRLRNPLGFGPTSTPGSGLGLIGLSERAELRGGRLEHRRHGGLFELHGWIPWRA